VQREYVVELLEDMLRVPKSSQDVPEDLMHISIEMDYPKDLFRFYLLHFAQDNLRDSDFSGHLPEANRSNIPKMVTDYARKWLAKFKDATQPLLESPEEDKILRFAQNNSHEYWIARSSRTMTYEKEVH
jgi:hypothetical protein